MDEIQLYPLTTNRLVVEFDREKFFSQYSIVSYCGAAKSLKNLAYEQLADAPFISVTGIGNRWEGHYYVKFFVMTNKGEEHNVLKSLNQYENIRSRIDSLEDYEENVQKRIIASLAVNSLGVRRKSKMMYNNGYLLISDDKNFLVPASRKELVCLKIEVNEYMNLTAKTTSFSNPFRIEDLKKHYTGAFQIAKDIDGDFWTGRAVKPVVLKNINEKTVNLEDFYIQKKRFSDNHNIVPYWPYHTDKYTHGRLFAITQVVDSVNEKYNGILSLSFKDYEVLSYDEYKSKDDMLDALSSYMSGKKIYVEDPFNVEASKQMLKQLKSEIQNLVPELIFEKKPSSDCMVVKLCEPRDANELQSQYTKSLNRLAYDGIALQHIIFHGSKKEDEITLSSARRILLDLMVKDCLAKRNIPSAISCKTEGWEFLRYKIRECGVVGASVSFSYDGEINLSDFGFSSFPDDFETFSHTELLFSQPEKISGRRDYMALKKEGNVYLIIDTDEIPILDAKEIDEGYNEVVQYGMTLSKFKRKAVAHKYLRGYIGMHLWQSEGLAGETNGSYSYIAGTNKESLQITPSTKMERLPRARRIFILHKENPDTVESQIHEITEMLKLGLGRWNEIMTYPFPFKFLQEYLDNLSELNLSKHWKEV